MPVPSPSDGGALDDVSCASAHACTAVGRAGPRRALGRSAAGTLAERFNGKRWTIQRTPTPTGSFIVELTGVSCPSRSTCTAVGSSYNRSEVDTKTLAERWNGERWTTQPTPNPHSGRYVNDYLYGVSCNSASACMAVGNRGGGGSLAERWSGAKWTVVPTPHFGAGASSGMADVWCGSAADCLGVGSRDSNKTFLAVPLAEQWDGKRWSSQPIPNPYPHEETGLDALGCSSRSACAAVGNATPSRIFAERWDGRTWAAQTTPVPPGAVSPAFSDVACASSQSCLAVGTYFDHQSGDWVSFAERWNGTGWTAQPVAGMRRG